jgi:hypothetical protein
MTTTTGPSYLEYIYIHCKQFNCSFFLDGLNSKFSSSVLIPFGTSKKPEDRNIKLNNMSFLSNYGVQHDFKIERMLMYSRYEGPVVVVIAW